MPAQHAAAVAERLDLGVERRRLAAVERSRPDGHGGALLDLAHLADHAAGAAADELGGRERLVYGLERRLGRREVRARGEHDGEVAGTAAERVARRGRRLGGAEARVRLRREPAADAYAHVTDLTPPAAARPAARCVRSWRRAALPVVALFGPTGVGKTEVAIALAELLRADGEDPVAVSADALQLYAGLEVLTGAASAAERARLEHRLLGVLPVTAGRPPATSPAAPTPRSTR